MKFRLLLLLILSLSAAAIVSAGELLSGIGAPAASLGANGDFYTREDNAALYKKADGAWSTILVHLADKGEAGTQGSTGQRGLAGPVGPPGPGLRIFPNATVRAAAVPDYIGQLTLQSDTNFLYRGTATTAGAWTLIPTQGAAGQDALAAQAHVLTADFVVDGADASPHALPSLSFTVPPGAAAFVLFSGSYSQTSGTTASGIKLSDGHGKEAFIYDYYGAQNHQSIGMSPYFVTNTTTATITYNYTAQPTHTAEAGRTGTLHAGAGFFLVPVNPGS